MHAYSAYPWKLAMLVDDGIDLDVRRALSHEFWTIPACCLDEQFSLKLRRLLDDGSPRDEEFMFSDVVQSFLKDVFSFCMAASVLQDHHSSLEDTLSILPMLHFSEMKAQKIPEEF